MFIYNETERSKHTQHQQQQREIFRENRDRKVHVRSYEKARDMESLIKMFNGESSVIQLSNISNKLFPVNTNQLCRVKSYHHYHHCYHRAYLFQARYDFQVRYALPLSTALAFNYDRYYCIAFQIKPRRCFLMHLLRIQSVLQLVIILQKTLQLWMMSI